MTNKQMGHHIINTMSTFSDVSPFRLDCPWSFSDIHHATAFCHETKGVSIRAPRMNLPFFGLEKSNVGWIAWDGERMVIYDLAKLGGDWNRC